MSLSRQFSRCNEFAQSAPAGPKSGNYSPIRAMDQSENTLENNRFRIVLRYPQTIKKNRTGGEMVHTFKFGFGKSEPGEWFRRC